MDIFVGNLLFEATEGDVKKLFEGFGNVSSVVIAMSKDKNTPKSRGFGFVQMPDGGQALAAIAALNGKEFMGRVLRVNPARPKGQKAMVWPPIRQRTMVWPPLAKAIAKAKTEVQLRVVRPPGTYRGGRRTRSYMSRRGLAGMQEEIKPRPRSQDNPMRWRKKKDQPKPWQKSPGEHKPWKKPAGDAKPWGKSTGEPRPRPLKRKEGEFKPWRKSTGESKPWRRKSKKRPRQSQIESRRKPGGYTR